MDVDESGAKSTSSGVTSGGEPAILDVLNATIDDLRSAFVPSLLAGLGLLLVLLPVLVLYVSGVVAAMLPGMLQEDLSLALSGFAGAMLIGLPVVVLVPAPFHHALMRSMAAHAEEGRDLGFGAAFRDLSRDLGKVLAYAVLVGVLFCYVGALVVWAFTGFGTQAVALDRLGPVAALRRSARHVLAHPTWHLGYLGIWFAIGVLVGNVPVLGYAVGLPFLALYQVRAYRAWFPAKAPRS